MSQDHGDHKGIIRPILVGASSTVLAAVVLAGLRIDESGQRVEADSLRAGDSVPAAAPASAGGRRPVIRRLPDSPVLFTVHDHLDDEQVQNAIQLTIGGISQSLASPSGGTYGERSFRLPRAGSYDYTARSVGTFYHEDKPLHSHSGMGSGTVRISGGETFDLRFDYSQGYAPYRIYLIEAN